jgi:hypothetical protein
VAGDEAEAGDADAEKKFSNQEVLTLMRYLKEAKEVYAAWAAAKTGGAKTAALTALRTTRSNKAKAAGKSDTRAMKRLDTLWGVITAVKTARWGRMMEDLAKAMEGRLRVRGEAVFTRKIKSLADKTRVRMCAHWLLALLVSLTHTPTLALSAVSGSGRPPSMRGS